MDAANNKSRRPIVVEFLATLFVTFCIGVATSIVLCATVILMAGEARGADLAPMRAAEARQGTLLFKADAKGETFAAPLLHTDVAIKVSGLAARAQVKQTFRNPSEDWYEGVYVFPLPENSAVDHLRMKIGSRIVEGVIRERGEAKKRYEQARDSGRRAALLDQERPNVFTSSVANIGPHEDVVVEIEYQQTLRYDLGRFSLRFPMVVGPRYIPGFMLVSGEAGTGWGQNSDRVPDASRITPPVLHPSNPRINPVSLRVELDAGVPIADLDSPYHRVSVRSTADRGEVVELDGSAPADRDFELSWAPVAESAPRSAWFTERRGDRTYGLLMILPPQAKAGGRRIPREAIYVIDTSGSMHGTSITQAREALELAIDGLAPEDRFNIVEFNSYAKALFRDAKPATRENKAEARGWVRGLRAQGGTEMALALNLALNGGESPGRIRQVVFLTDGQVGNENELFALIRAKLGDSRLFTVGIGSAPNSHFMAKAAEIGRGSFTYIGKVEEVREKMSGLFAKLESPVLKGVSIDWPEGTAAEMWPARIPDLYAGEPAVVSVALEKAEGRATVSGLRGEARWEQAIALDQPAGGSGLGVLWARDKIGSLMDGLNDKSREGAAAEEIRAKVIELAMTHHLVTKYTSLVAIDRAPARATDLDLKTAALPTQLPEGQSYEAIFGGAPQADTLPYGRLPQGATDSRFQLLAGALTLLLAALLFMQALSLREKRIRLWRERRG
jgi:Ca-activated chloride channel family protein